MSTRFYYGQKDYIVQLNAMDDIATSSATSAAASAAAASATLANVVHVDTATQGLTTTQQSNGRTNIAAAASANPIFTGNMGQNTTPHASWWGSARAHEIGRNGNGMFGLTNDDEINLGANVINTASGTYIYANADTASLYRQAAGQHVWYNAGAGTAGAAMTLTEVMRTTTAGQLCIGVTGTINGSRLNIVTSAAGTGSVAALRNNDSTAASAWVAQDDTASRYMEMGVLGSASTMTADYGVASEGYMRSSTNAVGMNITAYTGYIRFTVGGATERMRITTSGVGINIAAPTQPLDVRHATGGHITTGRTTNVGATSEPGNLYCTAPNASSNSRIWTAIRSIVVTPTDSAEASALSFSTQKAGALVEAMRVDSNSNLLLGTTSALPFTGRAAIKYAGGGTQYGIVLQPTTDSTNALHFVNAAGTAVGSITTSATATTYNTSSDYRLKYNVKSMTSAMDVVMRLKPVTYQWKADNSIGQGFIAHELAEEIPLAVTGTKDAETDDGNPLYQAIDTSKIVAHLVAALQELKRDFDAYKASHQ